MAESLEPKDAFQLHQTHERTLLSWIRTGIALMAFGFAIARFGLVIRQMGSAGANDLVAAAGLDSGEIGAALVALGMVINLAATVRYARNRRALERGEVSPPGALLVYVLGGLATLIGLVMTILLARAL